MSDLGGAVESWGDSKAVPTGGQEEAGRGVAKACRRALLARPTPYFFRTWEEANGGGAQGRPGGIPLVARRGGGGPNTDGRAMVGGGGPDRRGGSGRGRRR